MSLVNLDGTTIFGAGSEWFWAMAQFVLVAASIFGIYFQLRAQRGSSLYEQSAAWLREWNEEVFMVHRLAAMLDLEGRRVEAGLPDSASNVCDFFERIGYLVGQQHLRASDTWQTVRPQIGFWWLAVAPYIEAARSQENNPSLYEWFEKLELEMQRLDVKEVGRVLSPGDVLPLRAAADDLARQLRLIADARNGIYPSRAAAPEAPEV